MSEAVKVAAEMAEREGRYRDAYGKWCELITESERYGIPDINLYNYYIRHRDYCNPDLRFLEYKKEYNYCYEFQYKGNVKVYERNK